MMLAPLDPMWWADRALCRDGDPDAMFPEGGTAKRRAAERRAARACVDCPVRSECLLYALQHREEHGVWGGMTAQDRGAITHRADRARTRARPLTVRATVGVREASASGVSLRELAATVRRSRPTSLEPRPAALR